MKPHAPPGLAWATALLFLALTGCHPAMSTQSQSGGAGQIVPNEFPLRFKKHSFEAYCYNTLNCKVVYDDFNFTRDRADSPSPPPRSPDYRDRWSASYIDILNFPPPALVQWTSLDGSTHEAKVDISEIFKDELILHKVPETEIPNGWAHDLMPAILLEVNDRTISVYMKAFIATKQPQKPGNANSNYRDDVVAAWSRTY